MVNKWSWVIVLNTSLVVFFCFAPCCHLHKPSVALFSRWSNVGFSRSWVPLNYSSLCEEPVSWPPASPCTPALFGLTFPHPPYSYITVHSWSWHDVIVEQLTRQCLVLAHIDSLQSKVFLHSCECAQRPCIVLSVIMRSSQPTQLLAKWLLSAMCVWHGYDVSGRERVYLCHSCFGNFVLEGDVFGAQPNPPIKIQSSPVFTSEAASVCEQYILEIIYKWSEIVTFITELLLPLSSHRQRLPYVQSSPPASWNSCFFLPMGNAPKPKQLLQPETVTCEGPKPSWIKRINPQATASLPAVC